MASSSCFSPLQTMNSHLCRNLFFTAVICLQLAAVEAWAGMYSCREASGSIRFTNAPSSPDCSPLGRKVKVPTKRKVWSKPSSYNPSSFDRYIWAAGSRYNIDPYLIKAVIRTESDFDSRAVSKKGAQGLMQLMPATANELRVHDPFDPADNINGGTKYLRKMLDTFGNNLVLSLAAYNAGPGTVTRAKGMPRIPETVRYVVKVLKYYRGYRGEGKS